MEYTTIQIQKTKEYLFWAIALLSLAIVIAYTARGIFTALKTASEIDESLLESAVPRLNVQELVKVHEKIYSKSTPGLDGI